MSHRQDLSDLIYKHEAALHDLSQKLARTRDQLSELRSEYTHLLWEKSALLQQIYAEHEELLDADQHMVLSMRRAAGQDDPAVLTSPHNDTSDT